MENSRQALKDAYTAFKLAPEDARAKADLHYALFDRILDEDACEHDHQQQCAVGKQLEKSLWSKLTNTQLGELVEWCNK